MFNNSSFPLKKIGTCAVAVLGMCLWAGDSLAQTEQEKVEFENPRVLDRPVVEDHTTSNEVVIPKVVTPKQTPLPINSTPIRREIVISPEGKKVEPVPSTLSFNIFLYVVDKFKAD
ncbi:hypothetical protein [Algoriphagus sp. CAU 1675]|uniref:hypothetical protein n=1 Tax=Algoriphagus sp. CAU 1675 TaxID=3032597 RepID=UPI0023DB8456|nr:hypothetical protein [Algoriphagus sp. CAU 1675]MDF2156657.1 hypothetical protein [Algoriphagus sp. CAU 1675]